MKYIVMQKTVKVGEGEMTREFPIIFPETLTHSIVAAALERHCPELRGGRPVSAGFISSTCIAGRQACNGKSETLKLNSRGEVDDKLMVMYDYLHGIID